MAKALLHERLGIPRDHLRKPEAVFRGDLYRLHRNRVCCFGCLKGGFKVSSGTVEGYRSSCGTEFDNSESASPEFASKQTGLGLLGMAVQLWKERGIHVRPFDS